MEDDNSPFDYINYSLLIINSVNGCLAKECYIQRIEKTMSYIPDLQQAWELLNEYNHEEFHLKHSQIVSHVMGYFAEKLGYGDEKEFWAVVGLLHDLDFEMYPDQHCVKVQEIMTEKDIDPRLIRAVASHGWGICCDIEPEHEMEKILYATDELTGLIGAAALMRPSKSVQDMEVSSLKKKFKDKKFAQGCSRDVIRNGAEKLGWELDKLFEQTILAMRTIEGM